jgi:hypothetical protein
MSTEFPAVAPSRSGSEPPPLPEALEARRERRLAAGFALLGVAVFGVAAILNPYDEAGRPRMNGTHRQLGLPPCTLQALTGVGCPSCGMTTAFALLAHGDPGAAWRTNWAGCVAALLAATGTAWFLLVAAGLPPGWLTADEVLKLTVALGSAVAVIRWLALLCGGAVSAAA